MGIIDALMAGIGLAMDAFAVSIGKGLSQRKIIIKNMLLIAFFFGFFQFAMPVIGYYFCRTFSGYIESFDHWIAFILLVFLGVKMIFECLSESKKEFKIKQTSTETVTVSIQNNKTEKTVKEEQEETKITTQQKNAKQEKENSTKLDIKELFLLAVATSIDALITGVTFAFGSGNIFLSSCIIGVITFMLSCVGFVIGNFFGSKFKTVAEILGGVVLILLGLKFLLEGYNIINLGF